MKVTASAEKLLCKLIIVYESGLAQFLRHGLIFRKYVKGEYCSTLEILIMIKNLEYVCLF